MWLAHLTGALRTILLLSLMTLKSLHIVLYKHTVSQEVTNINNSGRFKEKCKMKKINRKRGEFMKTERRIFFDKNVVSAKQNIV